MPPRPEPTEPKQTPQDTRQRRSNAKRMRANRLFQYLCLVATAMAVLMLIVLLASVLTQGVGGLNLGLLTQGNSSEADMAGVSVSLIGTIMIVAICAIAAIPLGVGTAILIEEYKPRNTALLKCHSIIETNIRNLAGVPSIVYGILGASAFAMMFGVFGPMGESRLSIGQSWYDLYQGEDKTVYYAPRQGSLVGDPDIVPASPQLSLYTTKTLNQKVEGLTWVSAQQIEPIRESILKELDAYENKLRDEIKNQRPDRRSPPEITPDEAVQIADAAIAAGTWQSDPKTFRTELISTIASINGLGFRELIAQQNAAVALGVDAEYRARVHQTIMIGKEPVRVDQKTWYHIALPFGRGVLAGGLTLMLVVLPIVIVASQEAIRAVPASYRQGALALGATKWQSVSKTTLPAAIPGICTGVILAISRAMGEAAPILVLGGTGYVTSAPQNLMDRFAALPMTIYYWSGLPDLAFQEVAAAGIIILLIVLLSFNALAIYIRQRAARHQA